MKKYFKLLFILVGLMVGFSSCTSTMKTMKEPNVLVQMKKEDFTLSDQVKASASSTRILMIDWSRLRKQEKGDAVNGLVGINLASIPVFGSVVLDPTQNYAMFELMKANPGYDVVFFPQFETTVEKPFLGLGFLYKKTTVTATARLGKMK